MISFTFNFVAFTIMQQPGNGGPNPPGMAMAPLGGQVVVPPNVPQGKNNDKYIFHTSSSHLSSKSPLLEPARICRSYPWSAEYGHSLHPSRCTF